MTHLITAKRFSHHISRQHKLALAHQISTFVTAPRLSFRKTRDILWRQAETLRGFNVRSLRDVTYFPKQVKVGVE